MLRDYTPEVGDRPPRGRHRGPADPDRAPPQRPRAALRRGQERPGRGMDVRQRRACRAGGRAVQQRRRQPRGHPPEHVRAQERHRHAGARTARTAGPRGRPRATQLANRNRKSYGKPVGGVPDAGVLLDAPPPDPARSSQESIAFQTANVGRVVLRGAYPWASRAFPVDDRPDFDADPADNPDASLPNQSTTEPRARTTQPVADHRSGAVRLLRHRGAVLRPARRGHDGASPDAARDRAADPSDGHIVRLAQTLRGLIPMLLDAAAPSPPSPIVAGLRLFECPHMTAAPAQLLGDAARGADDRHARRSATSLPRSTSRSTGRSPRRSRTARPRATCRGWPSRDLRLALPRPAGARTCR